MSGHIVVPNQSPAPGKLSHGRPQTGAHRSQTQKMWACGEGGGGGQWSPLTLSALRWHTATGGVSPAQSVSLVRGHLILGQLKAIDRWVAHGVLSVGAPNSLKVGGCKAFG